MANYKDIITGTLSNLANKAKEVADNPGVKDAVGKVKTVDDDAAGKVKGAVEGSTVKEVYDQGASRVKSYGHMAKLSLEINGDYEELKRVYTEIGKLCYEQQKDAPQEFFAPLFAQVQEITARIQKNEDTIAEMKAEQDITVEVVEDAAEEFTAAADDFESVVTATESDGSSTEEN
jgi:hypothetical protein